jgi:hypothetical protein
MMIRDSLGRGSVAYDQYGISDVGVYSMPTVTLQHSPKIYPVRNRAKIALKD